VNCAISSKEHDCFSRLDGRRMNVPTYQCTLAKESQQTEEGKLFAMFPHNQGIRRTPRFRGCPHSLVPSTPTLDTLTKPSSPTTPQIHDISTHLNHTWRLHLSATIGLSGIRALLQSSPWGLQIALYDRCILMLNTSVHRSLMMLSASGVRELVHWMGQ